MAWPVGEKFMEHLAHNEPGPGVNAPPDPNVPDDTLVKMKGIRGAPTERLQRNLGVIHNRLHTPEGMGEFSGPRRSLIEQGIRGRMVGHELQLRGEAVGECRYCWGHDNDQ